jgi:hypothetical protein
VSFILFDIIDSAQQRTKSLSQSFGFIFMRAYKRLAAQEELDSIARRRERNPPAGSQENKEIAFFRYFF